MPVIIVNSKLFGIKPDLVLTFHDIANLAKIPGAPSMTMKHRRQPGQPQLEGRIIHPGEAIVPIDGMIFNVADTGNA